VSLTTVIIRSLHFTNYRFSTKIEKMFRLFLFAIVATVFCYALPDTTPEREITGKLTWPSKDHINANWKILIELREKDVMVPIASTILRDATTLPISYTLKYKPSDIKRDRIYLLFVRINGSNDQLLFTNHAGTPIVFTDVKALVMDLTLHRVEEHSGKACSPVKCSTPCEFGHEKKDGCEICECRDPCKHKKCEAKEKCVVQKKDDGKFLAHCEAASPKRSLETEATHAMKKHLEDPAHTKADCLLPWKSGQCPEGKGKVHRYWYNSEKKTCERFEWSPCGEINNNRFTKLEDCEKLCKN